MKLTAKCYGWKLTGTLEACEECQMSNAQQKKASKTTETQSETPGERLLVDMSSVSKHKSLGGARVWLAAVDDATGHTWSHLIEKKSHTPKHLRTLVRRLNNRENPVKCTRMDDAGSPRISYSGMEDNELQLQTLIDYHSCCYLFCYHLTTPCCPGAILINVMLTLAALAKFG